MTFFATLLFGAGALLLISALEDVPFLATIGQIAAGDTTIHSAASSGNTTSSAGTTPNQAAQAGNNYPVQPWWWQYVPH